MNEITLVLRLQDPPSVLTRAVALAREQSASLQVLLLMDSHLYHYGHNDVVVPGRARAGFLTYVSCQIADQGREKAEEIRLKAVEQDVRVRIEPIIEEDCRGLLQARLAAGMGPVMAVSARRSLFPLFKNDPVSAALKDAGREVIPL